MIAASFAPHVPEDTRLLILGSLPGKASLAAGQYYAHPRNQFWRLVGEVIGRDLPALDYSRRLELLARHRIGLWDVVKEAERKGSLDTAIRNASPNDFATLVSALPNLRAIAFNGATANALGRKQLANLALPAIRLPSSSPAYAAMSYDAKRQIWMSLRDYL